MRRRKVLLGTGVVWSTIIAGCADDVASDEEDGNGDEGDDTGTDDATDGENGDDSGADDDGEGGEGGLEDEETIEGLAIVEHELVEEEYAVSVTGVVANDTGEELGSVEVSAVFYDADGERIDDSVTKTADLADGEEWAFEMMVVGDPEEIDDYTIAITGAVPSERTVT